MAWFRLNGAAPGDARQLNRLQYQPVTDFQAVIPHWVDKAMRRTVQFNPRRRYEVLSEFEADLKKPNPAFLREEQAPLLERHPLAFWRGASVLLLLSKVLLYLWLTATH